MNQDKNENKAVAIIPARGGSKGLPGKNIKALGGIPLVARTILAAKRAEHVREIFVTTDAAEIAEVAKAYGAEIIWRPKELSGDEASSEAALLHAVHYLGTVDNRFPNFAFLQCTSPFIQPHDIDGVLALLAKGYDTAFTATAFWHFIWSNSDGGAKGINHVEGTRQRRQDRSPQYMETGAAYAIDAEQFIQKKHRFFGKIGMHIVDGLLSIEIDTPEDFALAEALASYKGL